MTEEVEKLRILASEKRRRGSFLWISRLERLRWEGEHKSCPKCQFKFPDTEEIFLTWSEVRQFIRSFVMPELVNPLNEADDPPFLVLMDATYQAEKDGKLPFEVPGLLTRLQYEESRKWWNLDYLSNLGSSILPTGFDETSSEGWRYVNRIYFLEPFAKDGGYLTITGLPRTGKTDKLCHILEMVHEEWPDAVVFTNVPFAWTETKPKPAWLREVTSASELLGCVADALETGQKWVWGYDEPSASGYVRAKGTTKETVNLDIFVRFIPKFLGSFILLEQRKEGVTSTVTDFAQSHIYTESPSFALADMPGGMKALKHIPKSDLPYRTGMAGAFEFDVDFAKAVRALRYRGGEVETGKTQAEALRAFLEREKLRREQPHDASTGQFQPKAVVPAITP